MNHSARRALLALAVLFAASAEAQKLELLGPSGAVAPEGFPLALRAVGAGGQSLPLSDPRVDASGAELKPLSSGGPLASYLVLPSPGAREVKVRAFHLGQSAEARFLIGPPAARVELELDPPAPVKQQDKQATLRVRMLRPDGSADPDSAPPVLRASVGTVEDLTLTRPGEYRARYLLPSTRFPEVAVIVALSAWPHPQSIHGAVGATRVAMPSAIELPGKTEREASFEIVIAGKRFGPVQAGSDGRFRLPVVVPPGFGAGVGTAVDRVGNRRTFAMNLALPETDQLSCVLNPPRLPADGVSRARVLCATSDPHGKVTAATHVEMSAKYGRLGPPRLIGKGIAERIYTSPRVLSAEPELIVATWRQGRRVSREELRLELTQGPAEKAELWAAEELVHRGGRLPLSLQVKDALDRPRPGATVEALASVAGAFAPFAEQGAPGQLVGAWTPLEAGPESSATLSVRAYGPAGTEPARIVAWADGKTLLAAVTDLAEAPVPGQALLVAGREVVTAGDGTVPIGPLVDGKVEIQHKHWRGLALTAHVLDGASRIFPAGSPTGLGLARLQVALGPAVPVNVRIRVEGRSVTYWVETPSGEVLRDRPVSVAISGGSLGLATEQDGRWTVTVSVDRKETFSVADRATGVTALAEVKP